MLKAKRGERCACGATVRVVRKLIHLEEARRIERHQDPAPPRGLPEAPIILRILPRKNRRKAAVTAAAPAAPTTPEIAPTKPEIPASRALKVGVWNAHNEPSAKK
jgi:hypothetical protein